MDITCPKCGATNRNTSRFCARCGEELPSTPQNTPEKAEGGLNLPWLQAVQERAVQRTSKLDEAEIGHEQPQEAAAPQEAPESPQIGEPQAPAPVTAEESTAQANDVAPAPAQTQEGAQAQAPEQAGDKPQEAGPDEPPPDWVVGILEPGATPQPATEESYEPEELAHIMPWLGGQQGEGQEQGQGQGQGSPGAETPGQAGLPPWLNGITVQETLETRQPDTAPTQAAPVEPFDPELLGLEPFIPPEMQEQGTTSRQKSTGAAPQSEEKVPDWLRRIESRKSADAQPVEEPTEPTIERFTPITQVVLSPTETLGTPLIREVPVRPPRPGAVETLAALIQSPPNTQPHAVPPPTSVLRTGALRPETVRSPVARWLLPDGLIYLVILAALLAVLMIRPPFGQVNAPAATDAIEFYNAVDAAPRDKPALLVFDWDASRSAEMSALSTAVTNHLMSRHVRFVTVSTVPQGPGFAEQITSDAANSSSANYGYVYGRDYLVLGYLPGGEAALRSLGGDITDVLPLVYMNNSPVVNSDIARGGKLRTIQDFGMVIDLAADETSLRTWVEQVASRTGVPMVAAVPQALEPLARPYRNVPGAGLRAVVSGQTGALQYEEQLTAHNLAGAVYNTQGLADRLNAQSVAQLLVALAILAAFVSMGTRRIFRR